jgi:Rrf2 family protein
MLSKTAEYALRAVTCMASHFGQPTSADDLAEATQVPRRYLNRVLQDLAAAELVRSRSGPGGGYELALQPHEVTILDRQCCITVRENSILPAWTQIA